MEGSVGKQSGLRPNPHPNPNPNWPTESPQSPPRLPAPLHPHSDSPLYLTHSTTNQSGGCSRGQRPRTPHSWWTRSNDLVLTLYSQVGAASLSACFVFFRTAGFVGSLCTSLRAPPDKFHTLLHLGSDCGTYPPPVQAVGRLYPKSESSGFGP